MTDSAISIDYIRTGFHASTKEEILKDLAERAVASGISDDAADTYQGFLDREKEVSTGFTDGFAIPHTRCGSIRKTGVLITTTTPGVDWPSMDGEPTTFIIALLVPDGDGGAEHMKLLSSISRSLVNKDFRNQLKEAKTPQEIYEKLKNVI